jgi:uncharacterized protein (TIGR02147 family)
MLLNDQSAISEILREKYLEIKSRRPKYSLRAFAKKLEVGSGSLTLIMDGKRRISQRKAESVAKKLELSPEEERKFLSEFRLKKTIKNKKEYQLFEINLFPPSQTWLVFGILNLVNVPFVDLSPLSIAQIFSIDEKEASEVLNKLFMQNLLSVDSDGKVFRTKERLTTIDDKANDALIEIQRSHIRKALESQEKDTVENRDLTALTMPLSTKSLPMIKKLIREFQDAIEEISDPEAYDSVYTLNMQLFPIARPRDIKRVSL